MRAVLARLLLAVVLTAPVGASTDLLHPAVCDPAIGCVAPQVCVSGLHCPASPCDPALQCEAHLFAQPSSCVVNATIDGSTCTTTLGFLVFAQRAVSVPVFGTVGATSVDGEAALVQGEVQSFNLPNAWVTPVAWTDVWVGGVPMGQTSAGVYRSDIVVPGRPRVPEVMGDQHVYSQTSVEVRHSGGQAGDVELVVGVVQLDHVPDGCFVRSSAQRDASCPRISQLLPVAS